MGSSPDLTRRQRDVLRLLAEGLPNSAIAERLGISTGTVKDHLSAVYHELGVHNRTQAALAAMRMGLTTRQTMATRTH